MLILIILSFVVSLLSLAGVVLIWLQMRKQQAPSFGPEFIELKSTVQALERGQRALAKELREDITEFRKEISTHLQTNREEQSKSLNQGFQTVNKQLNAVQQANESKLEALRAAVEKRLELLQKDNNLKLDQMRGVVDEKLQTTLEKRLSESFKMVGERLDQVHKGLGEMQVLATGVSDLKKVLTNVKTRGTWGEVQLGNLLDQILTQEQYEKNVVVKPGSAERVEFAIKLPGKSEKKPVYLPIDAKFPQEDYQKLVLAAEQTDVEGLEVATKQLADRVKAEAKDIKTKYIDPPHTTDFAILFLPVEGLYAEVLRIPGLAETLQRSYRVIVAGPTTLAALLNSLQMGFRTLAIQQRSSQVWSLLSVVKTEFSKYGDLLAKTREKLQTAANTIEQAEQKSRTIERRLRGVEELPSPTSSEDMFSLPDAVEPKISSEE